MRTVQAIDQEIADARNRIVLLEQEREKSQEATRRQTIARHLRALAQAVEQGQGEIDGPSTDHVTEMGNRHVVTRYTAQCPCEGSARNMIALLKVPA